MAPLVFYVVGALCMRFYFKQPQVEQLPSDVKRKGIAIQTEATDTQSRVEIRLQQIPQEVFFTQFVECFHVRPDCYGLRKALTDIKSRRLYQLCERDCLATRGSGSEPANAPELVFHTSQEAEKAVATSQMGQGAGANLPMPLNPDWNSWLRHMQRVSSEGNS